MTTGEAATLLKLSRRTVLRLCEARVIRANRSGGRWLIRRDALEAWLGVSIPANDNSNAASAA